MIGWVDSYIPSMLAKNVPMGKGGYVFHRDSFQRKYTPPSPSKPARGVCMGGGVVVVLRERFVWGFCMGGYMIALYGGFVQGVAIMRYT